MVCIPCIVIPVLLYIWHRFLQPIVLKFWNPWKTVEDGKPRPPNSQGDKPPCEGSEQIKTKLMDGDAKLSEKVTNGELTADHVKSE